ncbi:MAG TPA: helix-hairpin-helix domain-containing protein [Bryobacteraceae bacterium]|jgi:competence protein ComEA
MKMRPEDYINPLRLHGTTALRYKEEVGTRFIIAVFGAGLCLNAQTLKLPDGPGKAVTQKVCGACHAAELVIGRQEERETWGAIVEDMIQRGAQGTDDEMYQVVDYLSTNFSKTSPVMKINVNKATAKDLQAALRLTDKQAAAIVHQRDEKGDFKSVDELEKVPGLDAAKIEASKNRLAF